MLALGARGRPAPRARARPRRGRARRAEQGLTFRDALAADPEITAHPSPTSTSCCGRSARWRGSTRSMRPGAGAVTRAARGLSRRRTRGSAAARRPSSSRPATSSSSPTRRCCRAGSGSPTSRTSLALDAIPAGDRRALLAALVELLDDASSSRRRATATSPTSRERRARAADRQRGGLAQRRPAAARGGADRVPDRAARAGARPRAPRSLRFAAALVELGRARARHADARLHVPAGRAADDRRPLAALVRLPGAARRRAAARRLRRGSTAARPARAASTARASRSTARGSPRCSASAGRSRTRATRCGRPTGFADLVSHAAIAAIGASRFAEDVELYGSDEFGLLRIGDELCRASALMPQKRNPYALVVLRGGAGTLIGRATGVLADPAHAVGPHRQPALRVRRGRRRGRARGAAAAPGRRGRRERSRSTASAAARALRESFALATDLAEAISLGDGPRLPLRVPRGRPRGGGRHARRRGARRRRSSCSGARSRSTRRSCATRSTRRPRSPRASCPAAPRRSRWTRCCATAGTRVAEAAAWVG